MALRPVAIDAIGAVLVDQVVLPHPREQVRGEGDGEGHQPVVEPHLDEGGAGIVPHPTLFYFEVCRESLRNDSK